MDHTASLGIKIKSLEARAAVSRQTSDSARTCGLYNSRDFRFGPIRTENSIHRAACKAIQQIYCFRARVLGFCGATGGDAFHQSGQIAAPALVSLLQGLSELIVYRHRIMQRSQGWITIPASPCRVRAAWS